MSNDTSFLESYLLLQPVWPCLSSTEQTGKDTYDIAHHSWFWQIELDAIIERMQFTVSLHSHGRISWSIFTKIGTDE